MTLQDDPATGTQHSLSLDSVYAAVAERRTQFDNLVWQVPALSLTAQAFLFTLALSPDGSRYSRTVACLLSMLTSFLTVQLLTKQRQAEIADAHWLARIEKSHGPSVGRAHGRRWAKRRARVSSDAGAFTGLQYLKGFQTWAWGLSLFGLAATANLVVTWMAPHWLAT